MYKLTILFFFLTAFNSQSLMDSYKITFDNENASYILQIKEGNLVMENQPNVTITAIVENNPVADTEKPPFDSAQGRVYKITKGATFEDGLKIRREHATDVDKIGEEDAVDIDKIGEEDVVDIDREIDALLFDTKDHQAYEIVLSYALVTVVEKSSNVKQQFAIGDNGLFVYIDRNELSLFK